MKRLSWKQSRRLLGWLACLSLVAAARPAGAAIPFDSRAFMRVSEVKPGMRGVGKTVFSGTKVETFDVKVISVMPRMNPTDPGRPLILVMMGGGPITARSTNIMSGMSGSPVYIGGRLVGAVAYGPEFPREPVAMLTPIEDMIGAWDPTLPGKEAWSQPPPPVQAAAPGAFPPGLGGQGGRELAQPVRVGDQTYRRIRFRSAPSGDGGRGEPSVFAPPGAGTLDMVPLAAPLGVSGLSPRGLEHLNGALGKFGVRATAGPGVKEVEQPIPLVAGSAFGVSLAVGDVDITATGTLTYRKGDQVLGFGHPMLDPGWGAVDMPLTTAYVHDVFPSLYSSFKMASPVKVVGSIRQDRPWAVAGVTGRTPDLIPVEVNVRDFGTGRRKTLRSQVMDDRFLTPQLLAVVTNEAIYRVRSTPGDATARVSTEIVTQELGAVKRENLFYDAMGIDSAALGDLQQGLGMLNSNPWQRVNVRGVKVNVEIDGTRRTAVVERAVVDREKYEPGDTVNIEVTLRPWAKEPVKRAMQIRIPEYAPNGRVTLRVHGGSGGGGAMLSAGPEGAGAPMMVRVGPSPMPPATSLKQLVENYLEKESNNQLVARLSLPSFTANIDGQKMRTLPPSLLEVMRSPRNSAVRLQSDEVKRAEETQWVISGMATVTLGIERRIYAEKESPSSRPSPSSPSGPPSTGDSPRPTFEDSEMDMMEDFDAGLPGSDMGNGRGTEDGGRGGPLSPSSASPAGLPSPVSRPVSHTPILAPRAEAPKPGAGDEEEEDEEAAKPPTPAGASAAEGEAKGEGKDGGKPDAPESAKKPAVESAPVRAAGRSPIVWRQNTAEQFGRGKLVGVATSSLGEVCLAPAVEKARSMDATYVWSVLHANGAVYAGTGDRGVLYRIQGDTVTPVLKSSELQILSLAKDAAGNVYAGTAPHGQIYRVTPDGKAGLLWGSPEQYILSLAVDSKGVVYAGTSPEGRIYRVTPDGEGTLFARVADPYVISLAVVGDDLYAGSGATGSVFRIGADGKVSTFFDPAEGTTASLVAGDKRGRIFVGTSPRGRIYRVNPDGRARVLQEKAEAAISSIATDGDGVAWATSGASIYRVEDTPGEPLVERVDNAAWPRFLTLALDGQGRVALGSITGEVYQLTVGPALRGELESAVRDAGSVARWGRLTWIARTPDGSRVTLQTRSGNSEQPDETWSPWSAEYAASGQTVTSPPARYLQYRAVLAAEKPGVHPVLSDVAIVYLPRNGEPKVTLSAPKGGESWSKKQTIRWSGSDPDKDVLLYDLFYSSDEGKTWAKLNRVVKPKESASAAASGKPLESTTPPPGTGAPSATPPAPAPGAPDPGKPAAPAAKPAATAAALEVQPRAGEAKPAEGTPAAAPAAGPKPPDAAPALPPSSGGTAGGAAPGKGKSDSLKETSYAWDTTEVPDGAYLIKLVASDRLSNPVDANNIERIVGPILVSNSAPTLALTGDPVVEADRTLRLSGRAQAKAPMAGVDYRVDEGEWTSAAAEDGIFDGESEGFSLRTAPAEEGEHTLEVRAVDAAGNHVTEKRKVTIR